MGNEDKNFDQKANSMAEHNAVLLTLSYTGSGTYIVEQGGANLPRMTFGFKKYQNCLQMQIRWLPNE